jgi:hypothetical protein
MVVHFRVDFEIANNRTNKYAGKMMIANSSPKPPAARAAYNRKTSDGLLMMIFR